MTTVQERIDDARVDFIISFAKLQECANKIAIEKGWWEEPVREDGTLIALMHEELSEALKCCRKHRPKDDHLPHLDGLTVELADVIIRIMDFAEHHELDVANALVQKMKFNLIREYKHGDKAF